MPFQSKPITANVIQSSPPTAEPIKTGDNGEVCRYFSQFNGVDSEVLFDNDIVLDGDWTLSFNFFLNSTSAFHFVASSQNAAGRIIYNNGVILIQPTDVQFSVTLLTNIRYSLRIERVSGVHTLYLNNSVYNGSVTDTTTRSIDSIGIEWGQATGAGRLNGWLGNFELIKNSVQEIDMPMDENTKDIDDSVNYYDNVSQSNIAVGSNIDFIEACPEKQTHVFVLGGQSNMVGRADYDNLGDYQANVFQLNQSGDVVQATSPLDHLDENAGDMGLTITFCDRYIANNPNVDILLVPCADGGTSFQGGEWGVGNPLYNAMKSRTATAMMSVSNPVLKGLLWHQGESDAGNASYESQLDAQMNDYKSFCSAYTSDIPIVLGELFRGWVGTNPDRVAIQDTIDNTPFRVTRSLAALSNDLTAFDGLHFDSLSLRTLGERYYDQYTNIINSEYEFIDGDLYVDGELWIEGGA